MAWRVPTADDLRAKLSGAEMDAFSKDATDYGTPVESVLLQTADTVRGFVRANRAAVLSPVEHSIPDMLVGPAMDYAAFDILKRLDIPINDARTKARESAEALLNKIAEGTITPEAGADVPAGSTTVAAPSISVKPPIL